MKRLWNRLGLIGDIHAEDDLLEATLRHLASLGVDRIAATGDVPDGRGSLDRCVQLLRDAGYAIDANLDLQALIVDPGIRFVLNGHSHRRMVRRFGGTTVINAGTLKHDHQPGFVVVDFAAGHADLHEFQGDTPHHTATESL